MAETYAQIETDLRAAERDAAQSRADQAVKLLEEARAVLAQGKPAAVVLAELRVLLR